MLQGNKKREPSAPSRPNENYGAARRPARPLVAMAIKVAISAAFVALMFLVAPPGSDTSSRQEGLVNIAAGVVVYGGCSLFQYSYRLTGRWWMAAMLGLAGCAVLMLGSFWILGALGNQTAGRVISALLFLVMALPLLWDLRLLVRFLWGAEDD